MRFCGGQAGGPLWLGRGCSGLGLRGWRAGLGPAVPCLASLNAALKQEWDRPCRCATPERAGEPARCHCFARGPEGRCPLLEALPEGSSPRNARAPQTRARSPHWPSKGMLLPLTAPPSTKVHPVQKSIFPLMARRRPLTLVVEHGEGALVRMGVAIVDEVNPKLHAWRIA